MAILAEEAIRLARSMIGTPYSRVDCIGLIRWIIRQAPGGVPGYTTAGTNTLWRSYGASAKYRDLTWRQEGIQGARAGMLAFKRSGEDVHHVGIVAERPQCGVQRGEDRESQGAGGDYASSPGNRGLTVIHSSSARGEVVETTLDSSWQLLAVHRYIGANPSVSSADTSPHEGRQEGKSVSAPLDRGAGTAEAVTEGFAKGENVMDVLFRARVATQSGPLNVRDAPDGGKIGSVPKGATVDVLAEPAQGWTFVRYGSMMGYVSSAYLERAASSGEEENVISVSPDVMIIDDEGNSFRPVGGWRVLIGGVD